METSSDRRLAGGKVGRWRAGVGGCSQMHRMELECATPDSAAAGPSDMSIATRLAGRV
ncbi:hypothetical protein TIFTF001_027150 [Ficus carica]|uniref:Uncharacterized protein n=1 Tax=Ficus carica TaxID=3494 RepID=A0AA88IY16_FICCA|nr:hypothetical protein TIFTF001_027150 [Ficus carica]